MSDAAAEAKAKGNDAFKAQKFEEAIEHFTAAISADPSGHVLYSNRSASYASLHQYDEALADADKCIALNGAWGKGYSRKGAALIGLGRLEDAIAAFEDGLKHEPDNASLRSGLEDARAKLEGGGGLGAIGNMFSDPALFGKLAANPQTMGFLKQPDFVAKINQLQRDPSSLSAHLQDPRIMQTLGMLMGVNVQSGADFAAEQADRPERKPPPPEPEPEPMEEDLSDEERAARAARKEADGHKEAGNAAYKAKRFDEAIGHYTKAAEVLPGEMTYLTNLAAVYFEQGEYRKSAETCADAVKVGRENRADYKNVAKAYARAGNALVKLDELEKAIKAYEDSMLENRTEDVEKRLKAAKRELQQRTAQAYLSDELAQVEKDRGNALFKEGKFVDAIGAYSEVRRALSACHPQLEDDAMPPGRRADAVREGLRTATRPAAPARRSAHRTLTGHEAACAPTAPPRRTRAHGAGDEAQPEGPRAIQQPRGVLPEADGMAARAQGLRQVHRHVPHVCQGAHAQGW